MPLAARACGGELSEYGDLTLAEVADLSEHPSKAGPSVLNICRSQALESYVLDKPIQYGFDDVITGWKVSIQGRRADAGRAGDVVKTHLHPNANKDCRGSVDEQVTVAYEIFPGHWMSKLKVKHPF